MIWFWTVLAVVGFACAGVYLWAYFETPTGMYDRKYDYLLIAVFVFLLSLADAARALR